MPDPGEYETEPTNGERPTLPTQEQVSAGGVAFRQGANGPEVALIAVSGGSDVAVRWQLPKGLVDAGESPEQAALREVREEAGLTCTLLTHLETIDYWYVGLSRRQRFRFHKFVHFYLLAYESGDVADHDHEVQESRWFPIDEARTRLAFRSEKAIVAQARKHLLPDADCAAVQQELPL